MTTTVGHHLSHPLTTGWDYECTLGLACFLAIATLIGFAIANMLVDDGEADRREPRPQETDRRARAAWMSDPGVRRTIRANHTLTRAMKTANPQAMRRTG